MTNIRSQLVAGMRRATDVQPTARPEAGRPNYETVDPYNDAAEVSIRGVNQKYLNSLNDQLKAGVITAEQHAVYMQQEHGDLGAIHPDHRYQQETAYDSPTAKHMAWMRDHIGNQEFSTSLSSFMNGDPTAVMAAHKLVDPESGVTQQDIQELYEDVVAHAMDSVDDKLEALGFGDIDADDLARYSKAVPAYGSQSRQLINSVMVGAVQGDMSDLAELAHRCRRWMQTGRT
ncbi:hypothetical protein [Biformimicrobium ophioploci]|uniref:Uncharacterized protein n=1 Tax=Biformimicrobium ophioploci TaxID=3036711 RepID=A0ABQ6LXY9_9GAMM|nr:hypothetical protein [Microbulbifer sp. NKW57]GMG86973.1 hypothetical protein MNKW57_12940 [Microbulbifer sp. NKW57]